MLPKTDFSPLVSNFIHIKRWDVTNHPYCNVMHVHISTLGPFYWHGLTIIPSWISNHMPVKAMDEIIYQFPNFNGWTIEVWEWLINFTPPYIWRQLLIHAKIIIYYMRINVCKMVPWSQLVAVSKRAAARIDRIDMTILATFERIVLRIDMNI